MSGAKQKGQVASAMPVRSSNSRCSLSSAPIVIDHIWVCWSINLPPCASWGGESNRI